MKLAGCVSAGSGAYNEDAAGYFLRDGHVDAAWVLDGVTGINPNHLLPSTTDACWLVEKTQKHLHTLAATDDSLLGILAALVSALQQEWNSVMGARVPPPDYDHPATCLTLAKRYDEGWKVLRLGDSMALSAQDGTARFHPLPPSDLHDLESELRAEAQRRRAKGPVDFAALLAEFKPKLVANRHRRNQPGSYGILVADSSALNMPEVIEVGWPESLLLCTDGFYRFVDTYGIGDDADLIKACCASDGVDNVLASLRHVEAMDPDCQKFLRFKPADDASAVMLVA